MVHLNYFHSKMSRHLAHARLFPFKFFKYKLVFHLRNIGIFKRISYNQGGYANAYSERNGPEPQMLPTWLRT